MRKIFNSAPLTPVCAILVLLILLGSSCSSSKRLSKLSYKYAMMGVENKIELFVYNKIINVDNDTKENNISAIEVEKESEEEEIKGIEIDTTGNLFYSYEDGIKLKEVFITEPKSKISNPTTIGNITVPFTVSVPDGLISEKMTMKLHPRVYIRQNKKETLNFPIEDITILGEDNNKGTDTVLSDSIEVIASQYPGLDRVYIGFSGDIYEDTAHICNFIMPERLEYPVISTSNLADTTEMVYDYMMKLRKANHGAKYSIEFAKNSAILSPNFGNNAQIIADIKEKLDALMKDAEFDLDSIAISATSSPEGAIAVNTKFSEKRTIAISDYFKTYIDSRAKYFKQRADSLRKCLNEEISSLNEAFGEGFISKEDLDYLLDSLKKVLAKTELPTINFKITPIAENWDDLYSLVAEDSVMTEQEKELFYETYEKFNNPDERETTMKKHSYYNYMSKELYPKLRVVKFDFHMHRKGLEHDTVWIAVPSEIYKEGVKALKEYDFEKAEQILKNYPSYNAAVCFIVRHKPFQALQILESPSMQIDFEHYKALRDSLTLIHVKQIHDSVQVPINVMPQIEEAKKEMDRAAKIEFLKAKAYIMRGGEENLNKALDSYLFILRMDKLNGLYNVALTGEKDIRGGVFGSSTYFDYTTRIDEYVQFLPEITTSKGSFSKIIDKYLEEITLQINKEEVKYYRPEKLAEYNEIRQAYLGMGYTPDIVDQIIFLGIDPPVIEN